MVAARRPSKRPGERHKPSLCSRSFGGGELRGEHVGLGLVSCDAGDPNALLTWKKNRGGVTRPECQGAQQLGLSKGKRIWKGSFLSGKVQKASEIFE